MGSSGKYLLCLFTLLLAMQGEPVPARTRTVVRWTGREVPAAADGILYVVRISCDSVPVCTCDDRLDDGRAIVSLTADELAARGILSLHEALAAFEGDSRPLFIELHAGAGPETDEERLAERDLVLRRATDAERAAFVTPVALADGAPAQWVMREVDRAACRSREVWLLTCDTLLCRRCAGKRSNPKTGYLSSDGCCAEGAQGIVVHRMRIASKTDAKRLRRGGRRVMVGDVDTAEDAAALRRCGVDFILTDEIGVLEADR